MRDGEDEPQGILSRYIRKVDGLLAEGSYLVIHITPRFTGDIPLMDIG